MSIKLGFFPSPAGTDPRAAKIAVIIGCFLFAAAIYVFGFPAYHVELLCQRTRGENISCLLKTQNRFEGHKEFDLGVDCTFRWEEFIVRRRYRSHKNYTIKTGCSHESIEFGLWPNINRKLEEEIQSLTSGTRNELLISVENGTLDLDIAATFLAVFGALLIGWPIYSLKEQKRIKLGKIRL